MKFALFGSIDTAGICLKILLDYFSREDIFVITQPDYGDVGNNVFSMAKKEKVNLIRHEELENGGLIFDYGFSVRYNRIFRKKIIEKFRNGIINMHGAPLPDYKGSANHIFAILNEEKEFGATLHFINEKIDEGEIVEKKLFLIEEHHTGYDLLEKSKVAGVEIFEKLVKRISKGEKIEGRKQSEGRLKTYKEADIRIFQEVDLSNIETKELLKRLKAFYHPDKSSVFSFIDGHKVEIKLQKDD